METGPSSSEKTSDQLSWVPEEQPPSSQARTYDCTFCKRGFSNAQALGGHMNLHRKDRAKLKQPSNDNHLSFDEEIPSRVSFVSPISANSVLEAERSDKRRSLPWLLPRRCEDQSFFKEEDLHEVGPRQLQLFDDTPPSPVDVLSIDQQGEITERRIQFEVPYERAVMEVDLELRLGPEP